MVLIVRVVIVSAMITVVIFVWSVGIFTLDKNTKYTDGLLTTPCNCGYATRGLDSIENEESGEILEGDFRECLFCKRIWLE